MTRRSSSKPPKTLAQVTSCALSGIQGALVQVEVDIHFGLPNMTIVGLPDLAVRESKDRLYAALRNADFHYPGSRVTVNLAPADVRKAGPAYDLPIALGVLLASGQLKCDLEDAVVVGEVALDGSLRHTNGILPVAAAARALGFQRIVVPRANAAEAGLVGEIEVVGAEDLKSLVLHLSGARKLPAPPPPPSISRSASPVGVDLAHVRGQEHARRALEIAAAGGHNLLMSGLPGAGKTLLARAMPSIMPPLTIDEALEVTSIYSVAGCLPQGVPLVMSRPFRSPHHTISNVGLIGGGSWPRPGEVSLAHHGVLFLDELPEFESHTIEVLRQPLEDRSVTITRAAGTATFPASFALIAARNPCPCGYYGDEIRECTCTAAAINRYSRRLSGPLLDRIDMHVHVPRVAYRKLVDRSPAESSAAVRTRVIAARKTQRSRLQTYRDGLTYEQRRRSPPAPNLATSNGELSTQHLGYICQPTDAGRDLLRLGMQQMGLSARGYHRVLKLARTIADLDGSDTVDHPHVAEALQYRSRPDQ